MYLELRGWAKILPSIETLEKEMLRREDEMERYLINCKCLVDFCFKL